MPDAVYPPPHVAAPQLKTPRPQNVRLAQPSDEDALVAMLHLMHGENGFSPLSEKKVRAIIKRGTTPPLPHEIKPIIGIIDDENGNIVGSVCLTAGVWWYSDDTNWHLEDLWLFVHPDHRSLKENLSAPLIQFAKWAADGVGLPLLLGILTNSRVEAKTRLYSKQIPWKGALFFYEPAHGTE